MRTFLTVALITMRLSAQTAGMPPVQPPKVLDLVFKVTDLSGNPVSAVAGSVQDLQVKEIGGEVRIELAADVLFDFDKSDILHKAADTLTRAAAIIRDRAKGVVRVEGHTDSKGGDAYNLPLSERRANAVRDWLRANGGLSKIAFVTKGFGATQPVAPNQKPDGTDDPIGRQKNRRVEIIMTSAR